ncbi:DHH family phosphoesterase [Candidatus Saccharibacteria bacterium]|nr:DHH family phosphoesterase [Candidatus Saccharibacteria bacterium]
MYENLKEQLSNYFSGKNHLVIVQGDNPDADSLASSLALEELLLEQNISSTLYCSVDVSHHLRYLDGWDRVTTELPEQFDGWILVDCSFENLLKNVEDKGDLEKLKQTPLLIIDHHDAPSDINYASVMVCDISCGATSQVIFNIAKTLDWKITKHAAEMMTVSILADTLGFTSQFLNNNSSPLRVVAELVDLGAELADLNERRLKQFQISTDIFGYKAELMKRVEFHYDNRIATIDIPHDEIKEYSMDYNPTVILDETRNIEGLAISIGFKIYEKLGNIYKVTARIRCGYGYRFADKLASQFADGGGHPYAAGFKVEGDDLNFAQIKRDTLDKAYQLLQEIDSVS